MRTYSAKPTDVKREWYVVDASQAPLGRLATEVAQLLTGKGKPQFTHHIDCGDYVIVINASQTIATGNKAEGKIYYHHTQHPGGIKQATFTEKMAVDPTFPITNAVRGMLPVNKLRDGRLLRLKVYAGAEHNHDPQQPMLITLKEAK